MRIASRRPFAIGGGQLLGRDHHGHLQEQGRYRQETQSVAGQEGRWYAQNRERQRQVMPPKRIQHIDAPGEDLPCVIALGQGFGSH